MAQKHGLTAGQITFFNRHIPPMEAGDYVITTWQDVQSTDLAPDGQKLDLTQFPHKHRLTQTFSVAAPRFAMDPGDVHAVFPPAGQLGAFDQNLASVVLRGGALPWERQMNPDKGHTVTPDDGTPYLAVVLVQASDLARPLTTYRASEILSPGAGVLGPQLTPEYQDNLGQVTAIRVTAGGSGYTSATVTVTGGAGDGATASADLANGVVTGAKVTNGGSGYVSAPIVKIDGTGRGFAATAQIENGAVTGITVTSAGSGYGASSALTLAGGGGTGASATPQISDGVVVGVTVTAGGAGYSADPSVAITGPGSGAQATAARGVQGRAIDLSTRSFEALMPRYTPDGVSEPRWLAHVRGVPVVGKEDGQAASDGEYSVVVGNRFAAPGPGPVAAITVEATGQGYTAAPDVTLSGGGGTGATAAAVINESGQVTRIQIVDGGSGYTAPPDVVITGTGSGATAAAQTAGAWQAHLVSLEGFTDFLGDAPDWTDPKTKTPVSSVRVVSLFSWSFQCLSEFGNFRDLMTNLAAPAQGAEGKDALLLRLPDPGPGDGSGPAKSVQAAFAQGYTALEYQTRSGANTFAWYRGPLTPLPVPKFDAPAWQNAGSAMIYDDASGVFDQSYAAGWQAGRLLALSDQSFGSQLRAWRRDGIGVANLLLERITQSAGNVLQTKLASPDLTKDDPATVAELETLLEADLFSDQIMAYLGDEFRSSVAPHLGKADGVAQSKATDAALADPAPPANVVQALKDLLATPVVASLLTKINGTALGTPAPSPMSYIVEWLGKLRLLSGVPFAQLVPDTRALPTESIRFFYVDPNYQKALLDGALSIGIENSQEVLYQALNYDLLEYGTQQEIFQARARLTGQSVHNPQSDPGTPLAGCLMRSAVVAGWPGLEVRAYATSTLGSDGLPVGSNPIEPLRMVRLAPEVLLCLFPEPPAWIEFSEPKEQLAFGFEDGKQIDLRWVSDHNSEATGSIIPDTHLSIADYMRDTGPSPVLDVAKLADGLQTTLTTAYGGTLPNTFDAADFAIQMVRAPEQMIFQNIAPKPGK